MYLNVYFEKRFLYEYYSIHIHSPICLRLCNGSFSMLDDDDDDVCVRARVCVYRMTQKYHLEGQVYSVPLIQQDLRREEAMHQITDALQYLENISTDIFSR